MIFHTLSRLSVFSLFYQACPSDSFSRVSFLRKPDFGRSVIIFSRTRHPLKAKTFFTAVFSDIQRPGFFSEYYQTVKRNLTT